MPESRTRTLINGNGKYILTILGFVISTAVVLLGIYAGWIKGLYASNDRVTGVEVRVELNEYAVKEFRKKQTIMREQLVKEQKDTRNHIDTKFDKLAEIVREQAK